MESFPVTCGLTKRIYHREALLFHESLGRGRSEGGSNASTQGSSSSMLVKMGEFVRLPVHVAMAATPADCNPHAHLARLDADCLHSKHAELGCPLSDTLKALTKNHAFGLGLADGAEHLPLPSQRFSSVERLRQLEEEALFDKKGNNPSASKWYRQEHSPASLRLVSPQMDKAFSFVSNDARPDGGSAENDEGEVVRVIALFEDSSVPGGGFAHVQRYVSSLYTILGEWGHPSELYRCDECTTVPLAAIVEAGVKVHDTSIWSKVMKNDVFPALKAIAALHVAGAVSASMANNSSSGVNNASSGELQVSSSSSSSSSAAENLVSMSVHPSALDDLSVRDDEPEEERIWRSLGGRVPLTASAIVSPDLLEEGKKSSLVHAKVYDLLTEHVRKKVKVTEYFCQKHYDMSNRWTDVPPAEEHVVSCGQTLRLARVLVPISFDLEEASLSSSSTSASSTSSSSIACPAGFVERTVVQVSCPSCNVKRVAAASEVPRVIGPALPSHTSSSIVVSTSAAATTDERLFYDVITQNGALIARNAGVYINEEENKAKAYAAALSLPFHFRRTKMDWEDEQSISAAKADEKKRLNEQPEVYTELFRKLHHQRPAKAWDRTAPLQVMYVTEISRCVKYATAIKKGQPLFELKGAPLYRPEYAPIPEAESRKFSFHELFLSRRCEAIEDVDVDFVIGPCKVFRADSAPASLLNELLVLPFADVFFVRSAVDHAAGASSLSAKLSSSSKAKAGASKSSVSSSNAINVSKSKRPALISSSSSLLKGQKRMTEMDDSSDAIGMVETKSRRQSVIAANRKRAASAKLDEEEEEEEEDGMDDEDDDDEELSSSSTCSASPGASVLSLLSSITGKRDESRFDVGLIRSMPIFPSTENDLSLSGMSSLRPELASHHPQNIHERTSDHAAQKTAVSSLPINILDIFAGCGGLSEGAHQVEGMKSIAAIEFEAPAANAFALNNPDAQVHCSDCNAILDVLLRPSQAQFYINRGVLTADQAAQLKNLKKGDIQMIMGGPPCQGFSGMNRHSKTAYSKAKNSHVVPYLSFCDFFRPNNFVLENVEKLMYYPSSDRHALVRMVLRVLLEMGYQCSVAVVQAATQGVPQSRTRTIFLASAPGHDLPHHPRPIHTFQRKEHRYSVSFSVGRNDIAALSGDTRMKVEVTATPKCRTPSLPLRFVRVRDILSDLPEVKNGDDERTAPKVYGKTPISASQYRFRMTKPSHLSRGAETEASRLDKAESLLLHHYPRELSGLVWERARLIPKQHPGADWRDLPNHDIVTKERVFPAMKYSGLDEDAIQKFSHDYPQILKLPRAVCACMSIKNPAERAKRSGTRECRQFLKECVIPWSLPHTGVRHNQWQGLYGRLIEGGSSATIVTQPTLIGKQGTWLHPLQDRIITVREAARMQGFPDHFRFQGAITMMYKQIGNAVPPPLGRAIAIEVMRSEQNTAARRVRENEYKTAL